MPNDSRSCGAAVRSADSPPHPPKLPASADGAVPASAATENRSDGSPQEGFRNPDHNTEQAVLEGLTTLAFDDVARRLLAGLLSQPGWESVTGTDAAGAPTMAAACLHPDGSLDTLVISAELAVAVRESKTGEVCWAAHCGPRAAVELFRQHTALDQAAGARP